MTELLSLYKPIYIYVVFMMTTIKYINLSRYDNYGILQTKDNNGPILAFLSFFIIFYGFRPISGHYFGDTSNYANSYYLLQTYGAFNLQGDTEVDNDWLFYSFEYLCAQLFDVHIFFTIVLFFYILVMYNGCLRLDKQHGATLMLFCIASFIFYGSAVNGIRNGVAFSFVIIAISFLCKGKIIPTLVFSMIAIGCHKSAILPVFCMFFSYYVRKPLLMFVAWFGAIAVSLVLGDSIGNMLSLISYDERLANNLNQNDFDGLILEPRFRWDFLLYSSMPILLGWYIIFKRKIVNDTYLVLFGTYIFANSFWVLAIRAAFSNRIANLSWFIYPIVLAYPLLNLPVFKKNHSKKTAIILLVHFGFTFLMYIIGKV